MLTSCAGASPTITSPTRLLLCLKCRINKVCRRHLIPLSALTPASYPSRTTMRTTIQISHSPFLEIVIQAFALQSRKWVSLQNKITNLWLAVDLQWRIAGSPSKNSTSCSPGSRQKTKLLAGSPWLKSHTRKVVESQLTRSAHSLVFEQRLPRSILFLKLKVGLPLNPSVCTLARTKVDKILATRWEP